MIPARYLRLVWILQNRHDKGSLCGCFLKRVFSYTGILWYRRFLIREFFDKKEILLYKSFLIRKFSDNENFRHGAVIMKFCDTEVLWYKISVIQKFCGTEVLWQKFSVTRFLWCGSFSGARVSLMWRFLVPTFSGMEFLWYGSSLMRNFLYGRFVARKFSNTEDLWCGDPL